MNTVSNFIVFFILLTLHAIQLGDPIKGPKMLVPGLEKVTLIYFFC